MYNTSNEANFFKHLGPYRLQYTGAVVLYRHRQYTPVQVKTVKHIWQPSLMDKMVVQALEEYRMQKHV